MSKELRELFDFLDEENDNENSGYVIDDDKKADWALEKIRQEREERDRLINLAKDKIDYYKQEIEKIESRCETSTSYLQSQLAAYFETVKHKQAKTQESYKLLNGSLVKKYGGYKYDYDDDIFVDYLKNNYPQLVKVIERPQWGEFKKITELTAEGDIINKETGEVLGFIKAAKKPDEFRVMTD